METRKNEMLLAIIGVLCGIYFIGTQRQWIVAGNVPLLILGGAFFLLYYTKQKSWAFWGGIVLFGVWGIRFSAQALHMSNIVGSFLLLLVPGILLLYRYQQTGWESYVTPGCFLFWMGCFRLMIEITGLTAKFCPFFIVSLILILYTSHLIKRKNIPLIKIMLWGLFLFLSVNIALIVVF